MISQLLPKPHQKPSYAEFDAFLRKLAEGTVDRKECFAMCRRLTLGASSAHLFFRSAKADVAAAGALANFLLPSVHVSIEYRAERPVAVAWLRDRNGDERDFQAGSRRSLALNIVDAAVQAWLSKGN